MPEKNITDSEKSLLNQSVGKLIRNLRVKTGMSGRDLGDAVGISQQQISRYEGGKCAFTLEQLQKFAVALNMSIWELMDILHCIMYYSLPEEDNTKT